MFLPGQPPRSAADPAAPPTAAAAPGDVMGGNRGDRGGDGSGERGGGGWRWPTPGRRTWPPRIWRRCRPRRRPSACAGWSGPSRCIPAASGAGALAAFLVLRRLRGRRAGLARAGAAVAGTRITERRGGRARSGGRGGWPPIRRWGRALAAFGEISASWARRSGSWTAKLPEAKQGGRRCRSCWRLRRAARSWRILAGLAEEMRRRCCARPTPMMVAGSRIGGCGWTGPCMARAGSRVT